MSAPADTRGGRLGRLVLARPLVFLDLETTGVDALNDRIVEISLLKMFPAAPDGTAAEPIVRTRRVNPGMPIPPGAVAVHGITDADVAAEPPFEKIAKSLHELLGDCDFAGFGVRKFDLPLLAAEFTRAGLSLDYRARHIIDGKDIFHSRERRDLTAAYALYCGGELKSAHSAEADMLASRDVILGQLERYDDLPADVPGLAAVGASSADPDAFDAEGKLKWIGDDVVINFGKSRGKSLRALAASEDGRGMLGWILQKDFGADVKTAVRNALAGRFPTRG